MFRLSGIFICTVWLVSCTPQGVSNWRTLDELSPDNDLFTVRVSAPSQFSIGEAIHFEITSERSGRLHVIQVDSQDDVIQIFPNEFDAENEISAGEPFLLPPDRDGGWGFAAEPPVGETLVGFFVLPKSSEFAEVINIDDGSITVNPNQGRVQWSLVKHYVDVVE